MLPGPRPRPASRRQAGFSLIELCVTLVVSFTFFLMALPPFSDLRQRSALRGAGDQALSFWNEARFEAVKRGQMVKVGVFTGASGAFCLGAATTTDAADTLPCDCLSEAPASNACDVARWPVDQSEWSGVRLAGASIAGSGGGTLRPVVIEPSRTMLTSAAARGTIGLAPAAGAHPYRLNLAIDNLGHGLLCESRTAAARLPGFDDRRCAD
jgi:type II secretory pathway pseudopilin PulG